MKKIYFLVLIISAYLLPMTALSQDLQQLPQLTPAKFITVENRLSANLRNEVHTRFPGQYSVIVLAGNNNITKQETATYLAQKTESPIFRVSLASIFTGIGQGFRQRIYNVFEAAKGKNWLLFFDEGEALFGRRTAVNNSHDRFDSEETSYFMELVEQYRRSIIISVADSNVNPRIFEKYIRFRVQ